MNSIPTFLKRAGMIVFALYLLVIPVSMAGMETAAGLILLTFLVSFIYVATRKGFRSAVRRLPLGTEGVLWGFFLIVCLGAIFKGKPDTDPIEVIGEVRWILILYALSFILKLVPLERWRDLYKPWMFVIGLVSIYGILQFFTGVDLVRSGEDAVTGQGSFWRATGFFSMSLTYAYSIGMAGFLALGWFFTLKDMKWKWIAFVTAALCFFATFGSMTRGAWLAMAAALALFLFFRRPKMGLVAVALMAAVTAALYFSSPTLQKRITSITDTENASNAIRLMLWRTNWEIFRDNPLLGVGLHENSKFLQEYYLELGFTKYAHYVGHAHNNFLQVLAGTGVIGFFCFVSFSVFFIWLSAYLYQATKGRDPIISGLAIGGLFAQLYLHMGGMTEANFFDGEVNHMLIMIWASQVAAYYHQKQVVPLKANGGVAP